MKLTDSLKRKLESAHSKAESEAILADAVNGAKKAGFELSEEDLDKVTGGVINIVKLPKR